MSDTPSDPTPTPAPEPVPEPAPAVEAPDAVSGDPETAAPVEEAPPSHVTDLLSRLRLEPIRAQVDVVLQWLDDHGFKL